MFYGSLHSDATDEQCAGAVAMHGLRFQLMPSHSLRIADGSSSAAAGECRRRDSFLDLRACKYFSKLPADAECPVPTVVLDFTPRSSDVWCGGVMNVDAPGQVLHGFPARRVRVVPRADAAHAATAAEATEAVWRACCAAAISSIGSAAGCAGATRWDAPDRGSSSRGAAFGDDDESGAACFGKRERD